MFNSLCYWPGTSHSGQSSHCHMQILIPTILLNYYNNCPTIDPEQQDITTTQQLTGDSCNTCRMLYLGSVKSLLHSATYTLSVAHNNMAAQP